MKLIKRHARMVMHLNATQEVPPFNGIGLLLMDLRPYTHTSFWPPFHTADISSTLYSIHLTILQNATGMLILATMTELVLLLDKLRTMSHVLPTLVMSSRKWTWITTDILRDARMPTSSTSWEAPRNMPPSSAASSPQAPLLHSALRASTSQPSLTTSEESWLLVLWREQKFCSAHPSRLYNIIDCNNPYFSHSSMIHIIFYFVSF